MLPVATFAAADASSVHALSAVVLVVYGIGRLVCHQRPERSFFLWAHQMPVCARCTGLYVAAAAGAPLALLFATGMSGARARALAALAGMPTLLTWTAEMAGMAHPSNTVRAVAALPLGFVAAWLVIATLTREATLADDRHAPRPGPR